MPCSRSNRALEAQPECSRSAGREPIDVQVEIAYDGNGAVGKDRPVVARIHWCGEAL